MPIEISKEHRERAIASIERYFKENMDEPIGNVAAGGLLGFFLDEIAPVVFNKAVEEAQQRMQERVAELDIDLHEAPFDYWHKFDKARKKR
jgi:uncharacterized protein (DUF2164 family)